MNKKIIISLSILSLFLGGCSKESSSRDAGYYSDSESTSNNVVINSTQKITYTVEYYLYGTNVFSVKDSIEDKVNEMNGHITSSYSSSSSASVVYKIPTDKLNEFLDYVDTFDGNSSKSITTKDITQDYAYSEARIEALQNQKASYNAILANLNTKDDLEKITQIYDKIAEIDEQLLTITNTKNYYDSVLNYSTVDITYRLDSYTEPTFLEEYGEYIVNFFTGLLEAILYILPVAAVGFGVFSALFFPIRAKNKKRLANKIKQIENEK